MVKHLILFTITAYMKGHKATCFSKRAKGARLNGLMPLERKWVFVRLVSAYFIVMVSAARLIPRASYVGLITTTLSSNLQY